VTRPLPARVDQGWREGVNSGTGVAKRRRRFLALANMSSSLSSGLSVAGAGSVAPRIPLFLAEGVVRGPIVDPLVLAAVFGFGASSQRRFNPWSVGFGGVVVEIVDGVAGTSLEGFSIDGTTELVAVRD
jgi:hypothetical protein